MGDLLNSFQEAGMPTRAILNETGLARFDCICGPRISGGEASRGNPSVRSSARTSIHLLVADHLVFCPSPTTASTASAQTCRLDASASTRTRSTSPQNRRDRRLEHDLHRAATTATRAPAQLGARAGAVPPPRREGLAEGGAEAVARLERPPPREKVQRAAAGATLSAPPRKLAAAATTTTKTPPALQEMTSWRALRVAHRVQSRQS